MLFRFNPWKHHLRWIRERLYQAVANPDDLNLRDNFLENIQSINSNYVDIYTGMYFPEHITQEIKQLLQKSGITDHKQFLLWLELNEFRLITLSDSSVWVIRNGIENEPTIHIHPGRNGSNIVRIHGNSWKTILITGLYYPNLPELNIDIMNQLRINVLNLPPIKETFNIQRLVKAFQILTMI
jgi:hypothetical protein